MKNPHHQGPLKQRRNNVWLNRLLGKNKRPPPPNQQAFVTHLIELRDRLLRILVAVLIVFLCLMPFANDLYLLLSKPLMSAMPEGATMIATEVAAPFLTPFKFALVFAIFLTVPVFLHQMWAFIAPGLYKKERKLVLPLLLVSTVLFYLGVLFAYSIVFPLVFSFLTSAAPEGVAVMTDISRYLEFVIKLFFAFGLAFEVPIVTFVVIWAGVTTVDALSKKRPYIIIGAFILGMFLTPPDAISQTLLAIPMWLLFELGLLAARKFVPAKNQNEDTSS